jgi:hypothetical protein
MVSRNQHLDQRMNWFDRQFLRAQDFADESDYHVDRRRRHLRLLHTPGVAEGILVRGAVGDTAVTVEAGTAIDDQGREIVQLATSTPIGLPPDPSTTAELYVGYGEVEAEQSEDPGIVGNTRIRETPRFSLRLGSDPVPTSGVLLAKLSVDAGKLTEEPDNDVRAKAGTSIGDVSVFSITLKRVGQPAVAWPRFTASAANQVTLAGDLRLESGRALLFQDAGQVRAAGDLQVLTGAPPGQERLRVGAQGGVSIGTSSPLGAALTIEHDGVPIGMRETGRDATAGGLWRMPLDLGQLRLDVNTAAAADFSTYATPLAVRAEQGMSHVTVGAGANGILHVRHIDGKRHISDDNDALYLNWATGQNVVVGSPNIPVDLVVYQNVHGSDLRLRKMPADDQTPSLTGVFLTNRMAGGGESSWAIYTAAAAAGTGVWSNAFEVWKYPGPRPCFRIAPTGDTYLVPSGGAETFVGGSLHVNGELRLHSARTGLVGFDGGGRSGYHWIRTDGDENEMWMAFAQPGDIGGQFHPRRIEFAVTTYQASDEGLKRDVTPLEGVLDKVGRIRSVSFVAADDGAEGAEQIGVLAQEVESEFPQLVATDRERGYKLVNYGGLTSVLLGAVRELQAELSRLAERVTALEQQDR